MNIDKYWDYKRDDYSNRPSILFQDEHIPWITDIGFDNIIDLGCGSGTLVRKLYDMGKRSVGVTYSPEEAGEQTDTDHSQGYWSGEIVLADMHELPFPDGLFDSFVMWDSLEHCVSPYIALCEAKRMIRDGGRGLIFMPGMNWLDCHCHIMTYSVPQMIQLFKQVKDLRCRIFEYKYPDDPNRYCEGMAVYQLEKVPGLEVRFAS